MPFPRIDDDILLTLTLVIALVALASFISVYLYGRFAKRARGAPSWSIPIAGPETEADRTVAPLTASHPGETGIIVLARGRDAFRARALSARAAGRSLDMMYYLWRGDLTGSLLVREVLAAADRGVRVRLLLDDINTRGLDPEYLALTGHSGVEVRLFNPAKNRVTSLRRGAEMALRLLSVTRRMHNKAWIVDGRFAVIGGRNIGDTYFDAARDINSSDMDAALIGPAVAAVETIFDTYWNSPLTLPITSLWKDREADLRGFRRSLAAIAAGGDAQRFLEATPPDTGLGAVFGGEPALHWNDAPRILCDPPEKTQRGEPDRWMIRSLAPLIAAASREVRVTTAYFVPGKQGVEGLRGLAERGVAVSVLTNSLASTNQVTVHGGYSEARPALLEAGIRLFELRPQDPSLGRITLFGTVGATLHAKNFTLDGRLGFIGSFNFDLRSAFLNTEMGLLVDDAAITAEIEAVFAAETAPARSYEALLEDGALRWRDQDGTILRHEPQASRGRLLVAAIVRLLPVKRQL
ncbi:MAG: phospholipase D family protein [Amaricoccus sp.]